MKQRPNKAYCLSLWCVAILFGITNFLLTAAAADAGSVNIYSARKDNLIRPLLDEFSKQTGIKTYLVTGKADALLNRLETEGAQSPVDLFITVDAGRLYYAQSKNLFQCLSEQQAKILSQRIPPQYRDVNRCWFGLSLRARAIIINPQRVKAVDIPSYEALALPQWRNQICIRPSSNIYNQSLVASLLANLGQQQTSAWLHAFVKNFARPPQGGDTDQIMAAANGACDIAVANTYYYALMLNSKNAEKRRAAEAMRVVFPNQQNRGTHINVSGAGISRHAPNFGNALKLLEYLSSVPAQTWYSKVNYEYPVVTGAPLSPTLEKLGDFKKDTINLQRLGELNREAFKLMQQAGWK